MQDDIEGGRKRGRRRTERSWARREKREEKEEREEIPHPINSEEGLIDAGQIVIVRGGVRRGGRRVRMKVSIIHLL